MAILTALYSSQLKNLGKILQFLELLNNKIRNRERETEKVMEKVMEREKFIFPITGKNGNGKNNFFPGTGMKKTIFPSRPCLWATLTGHHVSPCEDGYTLLVNTMQVHNLYV